MRQSRKREVHRRLRREARLFHSPMATTTRYHLLPEDNRPSEDNSVAESEHLLASIHSDTAPSKERFHISGHVTFYTRLAVICLLLPAFIILIIPGVRETIPVEVFGMICIVRNGWVLLSHIVPTFLRIQIRIVGRSPSLPIKKSRPQYLKRRLIEMAIDVLIWIPLFVSTTVVGSRLRQCRLNYWGGPWYVCRNGAFLPGMVLTWLACGIYLFSIIDGGKPDLLKASAGFTYDEEKAPGDSTSGMLAHGGLAVGTESRKDRDESPVVM